MVKLEEVEDEAFLQEKNANDEDDWDTDSGSLPQLFLAPRPCSRKGKAAIMKAESVLSIIHCTLHELTPD